MVGGGDGETELFLIDPITIGTIARSAANPDKGVINCNPPGGISSPLLSSPLQSTDIYHSQSGQFSTLHINIVKIILSNLFIKPREIRNKTSTSGFLTRYLIRILTKCINFLHGLINNLPSIRESSYTTHYNLVWIRNICFISWQGLALSSVVCLLFVETWSWLDVRCEGAAGRGSRAELPGLTSQS